MKKKRGTKKKKKTSNSKSTNNADGEDKIEGSEGINPSTLISENDPQGTKADTKKKKKGKKKKVSKSEKSMLALEKKIEKLKLNESNYDSIINRMHQWMVDKAKIATDVFKLMDINGEGLLSYDEFKAGMFDLNAPLNKVELHLLCTLLDKDETGEIDYTEFKAGLQLVREVREVDRQRFRDDHILLATQRKFPTCPCCKMIITEPWREEVPRYILLELRCVTFDMIKDYPGHLKLLVHAHLRICGLIQMIIAETDISSTKLAVFRDKSRSADSVLSPDITLEEYGFNGDSRDSPEEQTLFYDYTVEFTDCPILMCDHYFGQKVQI
ncbi:unnamed protein product [Lymnaea stagnalis]|uniref:EF-hand domain-containing protein n=1 Tax=Lymnaea stagnalis TaxID=6523 RepID=A0AAV2HYV4_LYMST